VGVLGDAPRRLEGDHRDSCLPAPVHGPDRDVLAAVAVRGVAAVGDPRLRAALLDGGRTVRPLGRASGAEI
ncbi:MAG TPA: hypothetical protein DD420_03860, partial [Streptomyces sp.]|nr:hypothetical protein [Streptomyces sp.]